MRITKRDKALLKWLEDVSLTKEKNGINNKIAGNLFYNNCKDPYYNASRRLKELYRNGFLKRHRKSISDDYIYYNDERPLSEHQMKLLEVYSKLSTLGDVILFEREVEVIGSKKKRKNDGLVVIKNNNIEYPIIIEIDKTHDTDITKINNIIESNYYQNRFGKMPTMLIVKRYEFQKKFYSKNINIVYIDWDLNNINELLFYK